MNKNQEQQINELAKNARLNINAYQRRKRIGKMGQAEQNLENVIKYLNEIEQQTLSENCKL